MKDIISNPTVGEQSASIVQIESSKLMPFIMLACLLSGISIAVSLCSLFWSEKQSLQIRDDAAAKYEAVLLDSKNKYETVLRDNTSKYETALRDNKRNFEIMMDKYQLTEREARLAQDDVTKYLKRGNQ